MHDRLRMQKWFREVAREVLEGKPVDGEKKW